MMAKNALVPSLNYRSDPILTEKNNLTIVIPCYNEVSLIPTLNSIEESANQGSSCNVIVVVNASESDPEEFKSRNVKLYLETLDWLKLKKHNLIQFSILVYNQLPEAISGVGLARKIGMDLAFEEFQKQKTNGIIVCLDADCTVDINYLSAIELYYKSNPKVKAANIYFEHQQLHDGIVKYELHLRYFKQCLLYINSPYPFHTVGSSMSVRSRTYQNSGGMNTRKAGEDFYFLQKLFTQYEFGEINETTVYPSSRISERVPFGTGMSMKKYQESNDLLTYNFESFRYLKILFQVVLDANDEVLWRNIARQKPMPEAILTFLDANNFDHQMLKIYANYKDHANRIEGFFRWFNNFRIIKCLHHMRDTDFPDVAVEVASQELLMNLGLESTSDRLLQLDMFRKLDKLASFMETKHITK